jgi:hypothetical protein
MHVGIPTTLEGNGGGSGCDEGLTSPVGKLKDGLDGGARGDRCFLGLGTTDHF